jgi:hypothetical protein
VYSLSAKVDANATIAPSSDFIIFINPPRFEKINVLKEFR